MGRSDSVSSELLEHHAQLLQSLWLFCQVAGSLDRNTTIGFYFDIAQA